MKRYFVPGALLIGALAVVEPRAAQASEAVLEQLMQATLAANEAAANSQKRVDDAAERTSALVAEYRGLQEKKRAFDLYNQQLQQLVDAQSQEVASLKRQIEETADVARRIMPMMARMIDALENFIDLDVPFLLTERRERVAKLRELMTRADVTESERYRRILEAYQIENDYGRTVEAYQDSVSLDGKDETVNVLRVGRVALVAQSLDGDRLGVWSAKDKRWMPLAGEYKSSITKGFRIARKQSAPDLVRLPIPTPEDAQ